MRKNNKEKLKDIAEKDDVVATSDMHVRNWQEQQHWLNDVDDSKSSPSQSGKNTVGPKSIEPQQKQQQQKR